MVDGYCYLQNQTNHSGTKVKFQADSPTAITDSTYTNPAGYYQINVQPGLYDVSYSHQGYTDYILQDQLLMVQTTLPTVTLHYGTHISGFLQGTLPTGLYFVDGHIMVDLGDSLIIEPGTVFLFNGFFHLSVHGTLISEGTEEDSIVYAPNIGIPYWQSIWMWSSVTFSTIIKYCNITGCGTNALDFCGASAVIENCTISNSISSFNMTGAGVDCYNNAHPLISNCIIINNATNYGGGIECLDQSFPIFENCMIINNSATINGGAMRIRNTATPTFINCVIAYNGPKGGIYIEDTAHPTFINCTIDSNWDPGADGYGIKLAENSYVTLENTIVSNNSTVGVSFNTTAGGQCDITYSDFFNSRNFSGTIPNLLGQNILVNNNGDSCDIFFNIQLNPEYYSTFGDSAYYLIANSPCIDAGNPLSTLDPDGTIADMGAYPFNHIPLLTINIMGDDAILSWQSIGSAEEYRIYYSSNPYFTPTGTPQAVVNAPDTSWTDENGLMQGKRYYRVVVEY
jgi:parallel beta-helix repeat protein